MKDNKTEAQKKLRILLYIAILSLPLLLTAAAGHRKAAFFIDEYLSYELADHDNNGYFYVDFEDGREYTGDEAFLDSALTERNKRFDYGNVWLNQSNDVHPPFYYALLHTVCSLTPGIFSKWQGILLNVLFGGVLLFFMYRFVFLFTGSEKAALFITLGYGLTGAFVDCGILIRMYMMLCAEVMILSCLLYELLFDRGKKRAVLYLLVFLTTVAGTLTQYYFLIYLFFIALCTSLILFFAKRYRDLLLFFLTMAAAGTAAYLIFPQMIFHIFKGYRGKQSFENLVTLGNVFFRVGRYVRSFLKNSGSLLFIPVIVLIVVLSVTEALRHGRVKDHGALMRMIPFFASSVCFICVVAKTSPIIAGRYIWCVCPVLFACVFSAFSILTAGSGLPRIIKTAAASVAVICACLTLTEGLEYDYEEFRPTVEKVAEYSDRELIYIYSPELFYATVLNYPAIRDYSSVRYYPSDDLEADRLPLDTDEKVIIIQNDVPDREELLKKICLAGGYGHTEKLTVNDTDFDSATWLVPCVNLPPLYKMFLRIYGCSGKTAGR